jgi:hypothetical protein
VSGARGLAGDVAAVGFVDEDGVERQELLEDCAQQGFESGPPVRTFPSFRGQRNWPGWWWSATTSSHVGYESWLERDRAMALDFDDDVVAFAAQPFWLFLQVEGRRRSHAPDFFARHRDGAATVIDCRPDERIKPRDASMFDATARVCEDIGWSYRRVGALPEVEAMNLRWLAGYRQRRFAVSDTTQRLRAVFAIPRPMMVGAASCGPLPTVLPVLFHLLWHHRLRTDLTTPLSESSVLTTT